MAQYTISIDERSLAGKSLLQYLSSLGVIIEKLKPVKKNGLDKALEDMKKGRVTQYDSVDDLFEHVTSMTQN